MNNKWLLLDCNYLCHRAAFSMGDLSFKGAATGTIYGFLKDVHNLQSKFDTNKLVFCFDCGRSLRTKSYPQYKQNRDVKKQKLTVEEKTFRREFQRQVKKLRKDYLKIIGFSNVFYEYGYESDDIIASICHHLPKGDEAIIVSSDKDLYQLITWRVSIYQPQKRELLTLQDFKKQYNISPADWMEVKATAGCSSDNIKGIKGVGEKTAIKFIRNKLKTNSKAYLSITSPEGRCVRNKNWHLVALPIKGTKIFKLNKHNHFSKKGWKKITKKLGMKSLQRHNIFLKVV